MGRDKTTKAEYLAMQIREEMERSGLNKLIDQINAVAAVTSVGGANDNLLVTYVDGIGHQVTLMFSLEVVAICPSTGTARVVGDLFLTRDKTPFDSKLFSFPGSFYVSMSGWIENAGGEVFGMAVKDLVKSFYAKEHLVKMPKAAADLSVFDSGTADFQDVIHRFDIAAGEVLSIREAVSDAQKSNNNKQATLANLNTRILDLTKQLAAAAKRKDTKPVPPKGNDGVTGESGRETVGKETEKAGTSAPSQQATTALLEALAGLQKVDATASEVTAAPMLVLDVKAEGAELVS